MEPHTSPAKSSFDLLKTLKRLLLFVALAFSITTVRVGHAGEPDERQPIVVGFYLTSLYEVQSSVGTFNADLWVWSRAPKQQNFSLALLEVSPLNGKYPLHTFGEYTEELPDSTVFSIRKLRGTFLHDYDLKNFPYDRQILKIIFESTEDSLKYNFAADPESDYDRLIKIPGWDIKSVKLTPTERVYGTTFGYPPGKKDASYSSVLVEIELSRNSPLLFWKITIGLFVAVVIALLSWSLSLTRDELFGARLALLGGSLLAAVLNQQFADSKAGETTVVTVIDSIHFFGIVVIGAVFVSTVVLRFNYRRLGKLVETEKYDVICCSALSLIFLISTIFIMLPIFWR